MNTFYNTSFPETRVRAAWRQRGQQLRAEQLQDNNDYLYEVVSNNILGRRPELYDALVKAIQTASHPNGYSIPLWTYNVTHYKDSWNNRHTALSTAFYSTEEMEVKLRRKGYHWVVGMVDPYFDPLDVSCVNETERDGYIGGWDTAWHWGQRPHSVHDVVRLTDFRHRIALLFGDDCYRVSYDVVARKALHEPLEAWVHRVELRVHYHPRGLYDTRRKEILDTKLKYESYTPASIDIDTHRLMPVPYVWTGVPGYRETVEEETPGFYNATPAHAPLPSNPPRLARGTGGLYTPSTSGYSTPTSPPPLIAVRSNGDGLRREDFAEVAQRLSFEEAPSSIHSYAGPDAMARCASDAVAEWGGEVNGYSGPPCHCDYHHPDAD